MNSIRLNKFLKSRKIIILSGAKILKVTIFNFIQIFLPTGRNQYEKKPGLYASCIFINCWFHYGKLLERRIFNFSLWLFEILCGSLCKKKVVTLRSHRIHRVPQSWILQLKIINYKAIFLFTFLLCQVAFPQNFQKNGTAGFTFLEVPATARTAALGEATLALSDENSASVFSNPGALGFSNLSHSFSVSYSPWFADIKDYATSFSMKTDYGDIGLGFIMFDYGTMPRTVIASGQKVYDVIGTFSANSMALGLTYSKMLTDHFSFGVTLKYAQEKIDVYKASNLLFDGGILYYTGLGSLRLAASIQNFGVNAKFINDEFKMPSVLKLGIATEVLGSFTSEYRVTLMAEALHPNDSKEKINIGGEFSWRNIFTIRAGYKFFYDEESYTLGFGINPKLNMPVSFDFAYSDYGRLGNISRFTLQLGFN